MRLNSRMKIFFAALLAWYLQALCTKAAEVPLEQLLQEVKPDAATKSFTPPLDATIIFSPGCEAAEVAAIKSARSKVRVQIYTFTSVPIATALIEAKARGVDVAVLMDAKAGQSTNKKVVEMLVTAGVPLKFDARHSIAHIKMTIIDGKAVLTGSFNYTRQAERSNAEMLVILLSDDLAERCNAEWNLHNEHAR